MSEAEQQSVPALSDEDIERRRLGFGSVAELYDKIRPAYPDPLINDVIGYGELSPGSHALDIGAGTGQATEQFAARGLTVLGLEPSQEMVEVARRRLNQPGMETEMVATDFESAQVAPDSYSVVYSATAWHWVDPEARWRLAHQALIPGGTLAVFWNWPRWRHSNLREELDEVYRASGADLGALGPMFPQEPSTVGLAKEWTREAEETGDFGDLQARLYSWAATYSPIEYVALLGSYSDHIVLDPNVRQYIYDGVERVIREGGGRLTLPYTTMLLLSRAL